MDGDHKEKQGAANLRCLSPSALWVTSLNRHLRSTSGSASTSSDLSSCVAGPRTLTPSQECAAVVCASESTAAANGPRRKQPRLIASQQPSGMQIGWYVLSASACSRQCLNYVLRRFKVRNYSTSYISLSVECCLHSINLHEYSNFACLTTVRLCTIHEHSNKTTVRIEQVHKRDKFS